MTNEPTPETDAIFRDNVPDDAQIAALLFCERLESENNALRADVARLRDVLQRIVSNGGSATNVMLFDARTELAK
jgi:hypothetical protein